MYIINNKMKFNIESWNVIMLNNNPNQRRPAVYVKLTEELYMFMLMTYDKSMFTVQIGDTNNIYDDITVDGYFFNSVNTPNFRPNFYMKNGYITIILDCEWKGYPDPRDCGTIEL